MKNFLTEWKKYLVESNEPNDPFKKNLEKIRSYFRYLIGRGVDDITPENAPILSQFELGDEIGSGSFGRVFSIKDNSLVIKIFFNAVNEEADIARMKDIADKLFAGSAGLSTMHYFEVGNIGESLKYVIMPRITTFKQSVTYKLNPKLFYAVSEALSEASGWYHEPKTKSYADFRDKFYKFVAQNLNSDLKFMKASEREEHKETFLSELNEFDETIHKILRIAHKTKLEQGGTDLHLDNLGFFAQKPDDWFFFDM